MQMEDKDPHPGFLYFTCGRFFRRGERVLVVVGEELERETKTEKEHLQTVDFRVFRQHRRCCVFVFLTTPSL